MEPLNQTLCSNCGAETARIHLTSIDHGVKEAGFLCESCLQSAGPPGLQGFLAELKNSVCRFCGGKGITTDFLDGILGNSGEPRFLCASCSSEYLRIGSERFAAFDSGSGKAPQAEQMKQLRAAAADIEAHMKKWVIQREN